MSPVHQEDCSLLVLRIHWKLGSKQDLAVQNLPKNQFCSIAKNIKCPHFDKGILREPEQGSQAAHLHEFSEKSCGKKAWKLIYKHLQKVR